MKIIIGFLTFLAVATIAVLFVYPWVFTTIRGVFESNDLGVIIALAACAVVTIPLIWLAVMLTALAVVITGVGQDQRRYKRELTRRNRNNRR
jgi:hypothetical protein